ncbi:Palmitoyltransferase [Gonapodya sp. JEL0774]|nr:Palmitoyltransferase [Gonapodya sp. JEL0774]
MWTEPGAPPKNWRPWRIAAKDIDKNNDEWDEEDDAPLALDSLTRAGITERNTGGNALRHRANPTADAHSNEANQTPVVMEFKKSVAAQRFCKKCQVYKPPRAHHCSPWVRNCVGHRNHGHFIRFITYTSLGILSDLFLFAKRMYDLVRYQNALAEYHQLSTARWEATSNGRDSGVLDLRKPMVDLTKIVTPHSTTGELVVMIVNLILLMILLATVGTLSVFQYMYIWDNTTTIETYETDRVKRMVNREKISPDRAVFPYDLGAFENFRNVLGRTWWAWWWPQPAVGNGLDWMVGPKARGLAKKFVDEDGVERVVVAWPPEEYYLEHGSRPKGSSSFRSDKSHGNGAGHDHGSGARYRRGSEGYVVRTTDYRMQHAAIEESGGIGEGNGDDESSGLGLEEWDENDTDAYDDDDATDNESE